MSTFIPPGECPLCGEWVPAKNLACPGCGACAQAGWNEENTYDGLDLPVAAYDDGDEKEPALSERDGRGGRVWLIRSIAVLLILILSGIWYLFTSINR